MKKFIKAFIVAFSMYSKIPMPRFNWASEDMKYHLCFFPGVGVVIAGLELLWIFLSSKFLSGCTELLFIAIAFVIPLLVTGGFHMDGYLDTMDALHSYGDKEKKLSILKDPHVGAFAIICVIVYTLVALGFVSVLYRRKIIEPMVTVLFSFVISRCLSGISVTCFEKAKKTGMVAVESSSSNKKVVGVVLVIELALTVAGLIWYDINFLPYAFACLGSMGLAFLYYYLMSKKQFGGINGDLAGFFVCISELAAIISCGILAAVGI